MLGRTETALPDTHAMCDPLSDHAQELSSLAVPISAGVLPSTGWRNNESRREKAKSLPSGDHVADVTVSPARDATSTRASPPSAGETRTPSCERNSSRPPSGDQRGCVSTLFESVDGGNIVPLKI